MLTSGGDNRITVPPGGVTNIYGASPFPRGIRGYAASTANDISVPAFEHLANVVAGWPEGDLGADDYAAALDALRARMRRVWGLPDDTAIVMAPSGTDLEFIALALAAARSGQPVTNILLGQDEVGSGCILSAAGRFFASETAVCECIKGDPVPGLDETLLVNVPVRDSLGAPSDSSEVAAQIDAFASEASALGRHALAHVVHGSKTGLVLPELADIDALRAAHGEALSFVVDACQVRIEAEAIRAYLERDAIVLLTGSKFAGGPPFSGFALVPASFHARAPLPQGLASVFRRAEWPLDWQSCGHLPGTANPGLLLRLEAAMFEIERFAHIDAAARARVIAGFGTAVRALAGRLGVALVEPALRGSALHQTTLATLDLSSLPGSPDFAVSQRWHKELAEQGLRLGQPVKCVRNAAGEWAGTLRISLSMPLIAELAQLADAPLHERLMADMMAVAGVLEAAQCASAAQVQ